MAYSKSPFIFLLTILLSVISTPISSATELTAGSADTASFPIVNFNSTEWAQYLVSPADGLTQSLSTLNKRKDDPDLTSIRNGGLFEDQLCFTAHPDSCSVTTRVHPDSYRIEVWIWDRTCRQIGGNTFVEIDKGPALEFPIFSELPYSVVLHQSATRPPSFWYAGKGYGYDHGVGTWCRNSGWTRNIPGFKLYCWAQFECGRG